MDKTKGRMFLIIISIMTILMLILYMNFENSVHLTKQGNQQYLTTDQMMQGTKDFISNLSNPLTAKPPPLPSLPTPKLP